MGLKNRIFLTAIGHLEQVVLPKLLEHAPFDLDELRLGGEERKFRHERRKTQSDLDVAAAPTVVSSRPPTQSRVFCGCCINANSIVGVSGSQLAESQEAHFFSPYDKVVAQIHFYKNKNTNPHSIRLFYHL